MCDLKELNRMYKITDLMITAHSKLGDKYRTYNIIYSGSILILSFLTILFIFASDSLLNTKILTFTLKNVIIFLSIMSFILSLLEIKLGWQSKENAHYEAARNYFSLKCKISDAKNNINEIKYQTIRAEYEKICNYNIPLPDEQFLKIKRYHNMKVLISKYLSKYKGAFIWLIKLKIIMKDNKKCVKKKNVI